MEPIELFHVGPQKSGTTWIYQCLREHPEVAAPVNDSVHYFDINYHRGRSWLDRFYSDRDAGKKRLDPTPSYLRSLLVPARIRQENPDARIALTMRHPVARAFSHYWHEKKKSRFNFSFSEVLDHYDLFASWIEPGFYAHHIDRLLDEFRREQLLVQRYEELASAPGDFLTELLNFYRVDSTFRPDILHERVNVASPREGRLARRARRKAAQWGRRVPAGEHLRSLFHTVHSGDSTRQSGVGSRNKRMEYLSEQPQELLEDLIAITLPETERLEAMLEIDLSAWRSVEGLR